MYLTWLRQQVYTRYPALSVWGSSSAPFYFYFVGTTVEPIIKKNGVHQWQYPYFRRIKSNEPTGWRIDYRLSFKFILNTGLNLDICYGQISLFKPSSFALQEASSSKPIESLKLVKGKHRHGDAHRQVFSISLQLSILTSSWHYFNTAQSITSATGNLSRITVPVEIE